MTRRRTGRLFAIITALALVATACTGSDETLTIYSGRGQNLVGPLLEQFADQTGTDINVKYGDSAELALLLAEEGEASRADVFLAQNPGAVAFVGDEGLLAELPPSVTQQVDPAFRSRDGHWIGLSGRQRVLVYNQDLVEESELPTSVFAVTDERFRGQVAVAPQNGSFQDFVSAMVVHEGEAVATDWLAAMAANDAPTYANNNAIVDAVSRGEVPMGLVNHYYNHRFLEEDPELPSRNYSFPGQDLGNLVISASVSIIEGTQQPEAAERFVEFLLSEQAQQYFSEETFEYPVVAGVEPAGELPGIDPSRYPDVAFDALGDTLQRTTELIADSGLQ
jgi:iron(III) transport system substrate-binding protein